MKKMKAILRVSVLAVLAFVMMAGNAFAYAGVGSYNVDNTISPDWHWGSGKCTTSYTYRFFNFNGIGTSTTTYYEIRELVNGQGNWVVVSGTKGEIDNPNGSNGHSFNVYTPSIVAGGTNNQFQLYVWNNNTGGYGYDSGQASCDGTNTP